MWARVTNRRRAAGEPDQQASGRVPFRVADEIRSIPVRVHDDRPGDLAQLLCSVVGSTHPMVLHSRGARTVPVAAARDASIAASTMRSDQPRLELHQSGRAYRSVIAGAQRLAAIGRTCTRTVVEHFRLLGREHLVGDSGPQGEHDRQRRRPPGWCGACDSRSPSIASCWRASAGSMRPLLELVEEQHPPAVPGAQRVPGRERAASGWSSTPVSRAPNAGHELAGGSAVARRSITGGAGGPQPGNKRRAPAMICRCPTGADHREPPVCHILRQPPGFLVAGVEERRVLFPERVSPRYGQPGSTSRAGRRQDALTGTRYAVPRRARCHDHAHHTVGPLAPRRCAENPPVTGDLGRPRLHPAGRLPPRSGRRPIPAS